MSTALGTGRALTAREPSKKQENTRLRPGLLFLPVYHGLCKQVFVVHTKKANRALAFANRSTHGERTDGPAVCKGWFVITIFPPPEATTASRSCPTSFSKSPNALA